MQLAAASPGTGGGSNNATANAAGNATAKNARIQELEAQVAGLQAHQQRFMQHAKALKPALWLIALAVK